MNKIPLTLSDGNAFSILWACQKAMRKAGLSAEWEAFSKEARAGDYDHLLATVVKRFEISLS
jgi:hypothetical protein